MGRPVYSNVLGRQADFFASVYHRCHGGSDENPEQGLITGVDDTEDNLSPVTMTPGLIYIAGVNDTKLQISPRIFVKIQNSPNKILRAMGGNCSVKKT